LLSSLPLSLATAALFLLPLLFLLARGTRFDKPWRIVERDPQLHKIYWPKEPERARFTDYSQAQQNIPPLELLIIVVGDHSDERNVNKEGCDHTGYHVSAHGSDPLVKETNHVGSFSSSAN